MLLLEAAWEMNFHGVSTGCASAITGIGRPNEIGQGIENRTAPAHGFGQAVASGISVHDANAVAVGGGQHHRETGKLEQRRALRARAGAELERERVLKNNQHRELALLDELLAEGFAQTRGDVPVNIADVVAEIVFYNLIELHAAPAERRAVFAA